MLCKCSFLDGGAVLSVEEKGVDSSVDAGAQVQQVINVECKSMFFESPLVSIRFR